MKIDIEQYKIDLDTAYQCGYYAGYKNALSDIKAEIVKIEIPEEVKTVDGSFAFCQALEIADIAIDRLMNKYT